MSESQNSPPPQLGTNSSSVAIAILVPFFALIFTGFGFYLYKQRYVLYQKNLNASFLRKVVWKVSPFRLIFFSNEALNVSHHILWHHHPNKCLNHQVKVFCYCGYRKCNVWRSYIAARPAPLIQVCASLCVRQAWEQTLFWLACIETTLRQNVLDKITSIIIQYILTHLSHWTHSDHTSLAQYYAPALESNPTNSIMLMIWAVWSYFNESKDIVLKCYLKVKVTHMNSTCVKVYISRNPEMLLKYSKFTWLHQVYITGNLYLQLHRNNSFKLKERKRPQNSSVQPYI